MVFNATFSNISAISWLSCFIGGVNQENHRPAASLTNLINNVVSSNKGVNEHSYHARFQFAK
jgi:hypothetical protein